MKKIIATIAASVLSVAAMAQKPGDGVLRIHTTDGEVTPIFTKNIKSMTFEEVTPLTMNIDVEETGTDYILVDFPMPEGCSHWLMYVGDEELVGDDRDVRIEMKKRYMEDWRESKYLQIPGLKDNTTYYIYALLYDNDGVPQVSAAPRQRPRLRQMTSSLSTSRTSSPIRLPSPSPRRTRRSSTTASSCRTRPAT